MERVKVIWISRFAPISIDASAGSRTFNYYFRSFSKDNRFDIRLISCGFYRFFQEIETENKDIEHKIIYWGDPSTSKISKFINVESRYNLFNSRCNLLSNTEFKSIVDTLNEHKSNNYIPDIVILEWTNMVMLASTVRKIFPKTSIVASEHDVMYIGAYRKYQYYKWFKKLIWKIRYSRLKKKELSELNKCNLILTHNVDYRGLLINQGLDKEKIKGLVPYFYNLSECKVSKDSKNILFYGAMGRPENYLSAIWFIDNVMPLLKNYNVKFVVLGRNPPDVLKKRSSNQIVITGFVDLIEPFFEDAMCFVAPLVLGAGIKVKILEAMSSGLPVLTNDIGIEGIGAKSNIDYYYCKSADDFAKRIERLIVYPEERNVGNNGKMFINNNFDVEKSLNNYKQMIFELLKLDNR